MVDRKKLIKFLKKHNVLKKFAVEYTIANKRKYHNGKCLRQILKKCSDYYVFEQTFVWAVSPSGYTFWSNLSKKWKEYLNEQ